MIKKIGSTVLLAVVFCLFCQLDFLRLSSETALAAPKENILIKEDMYAVDFINEKEGWACGIRGAIFHTTDGGIIWENQSLKTNLPLNAISFSGSQVGWVVGYGGIIFHTVNGGKTWVGQSPPKKKHLLAVKALSSEICWAVGDWGTILYTEDGGKTWIDRTYPKDVVIYDIDFQGDEGWMCGEFGTILYTKDKGKAWSLQTTGIETTIFGLSFTSKKVGVAVGLSGVILRTENGGKTWEKVKGFQNNPEKADHLQGDEWRRSLYEVKLNGLLGIAAGDAGLIIITQDGGKNWSPIPLPMDMRLFWFRGIALVQNKGLIVGARSIVVMTQDDTMRLLGFLPKVQPPGR